MHKNNAPDAAKALEMLMEGNRRYMTENYAADTSMAARKKTFDEGQFPYAIVITCSDSRVIPERIFDAGIGEIFVIRTAGNVIGPGELGSIEYAAEHLGCDLALVLGHDRCGAVNAAVASDPQGYVKAITDVIKRAIAGENDEEKACILNVKNSMKTISAALPGLTVKGAVYRLESGRVELL